jgi:hypothetical protein
MGDRVLTSIRSRLRSVRSEDNREAGIGLILVIGIAIFVTALTTTAVAIAMSGLSQSRNRVSYEQALAVAETGVDFALGNIQKAFDDYAADFPIPSPVTVAEPSPVCPLAAMADTTARPMTDTQERDWAKQQIQTIITDSNQSCIQHSPNGDYVIFKPLATLANGAPKAGRVYVQSWVPRYGDPHAVSRLIKNEYVFMPYRPQMAVLTGGDLQIDSSTTVTAASGVNPLTAGVHANGEITVASGNPSVSGAVTSTDSSSGSSNNFTSPSNPGGAITHLDKQRLPVIDAISLYKQAPANLPNMSTWFDLCPDGSVRSYSPDATPTPCDGTVLNAASGGGFVQPFRGWSLNTSTHTWIADTPISDGIYYAYQANVDVGNGNGSVSNLTVIAQAAYSSGVVSCANKMYGSINWNHYALGAPAYPNLWFYADSDINTGTNFTAGSNSSASAVISGMFVTGDQINMQTSSQGAVGSVVAADQCPSKPMGSTPVVEPQLPGEGSVTTNEIKNPAIYFDPNANAPFTSIVDTTLWLEYVG